MLEKAEKRILLGVYLRDRRVGRAQYYLAENLNWLASRSYHFAREWAGAAVLPKHAPCESDTFHDSWLQSQRAASAMSHLEGAGMVGISHPSGHEEVFEVFVTYRGAEYARLLATRWGRADLWYRERKDGVAGLGVTVVVAALTTIVTLWIKHALA